MSQLVFCAKYYIITSGKLSNYGKNNQTGTGPATSPVEARKGGGEIRMTLAAANQPSTAHN